MAIVADGLSAVHWWGVAMIAASWVVSPVVTGVIAAMGFAALRRGVLRSTQSLQRSFWVGPHTVFAPEYFCPTIFLIDNILCPRILFPQHPPTRYRYFSNDVPHPLHGRCVSNQVLPPLVWLTFFIITWFMLAEAGKNLHLNELAAWKLALLSCGAGTVAGAACALLVVPRLKQRVASDSQSAAIALGYVPSCGCAMAWCASNDYHDQCVAMRTHTCVWRVPSSAALLTAC